MPPCAVRAGLLLLTERFCTCPMCVMRPAECSLLCHCMSGRYLFIGGRFALAVLERLDLYINGTVGICLCVDADGTIAFVSLSMWSIGTCFCSVIERLNGWNLSLDGRYALSLSDWNLHTGINGRRARRSALLCEIWPSARDERCLRLFIRVNHTTCVDSVCW